MLTIATDNLLVWKVLLYPFEKVDLIDTVPLRRVLKNQSSYSFLVENTIQVFAYKYVE